MPEKKKGLLKEKQKTRLQLLAGQAARGLLPCEPAKKKARGKMLEQNQRAKARLTKPTEVAKLRVQGQIQTDQLKAGKQE